MTLILHRGARLVPRSDLDAVKAPEPTSTWFPIKHSDVLDAVTQTLREANFVLAKEPQLSLTENKARFFGVLDLQNELVPGVGLSVGVRNSIDQTFPIGFCAGSRVFVCDNLAFRSELMVKRKHTRNGGSRFREDIAKAVVSLSQFRDAEEKRIIQMRENEVGTWQADHLILSAFERGIVSSKLLPDVIRGWREPGHDDFQPRTFWSLFNAFTGALKERATTNPQDFAVRTMRLYGLLNPLEN